MYVFMLQYLNPPLEGGTITVLHVPEKLQKPAESILPAKPSSFWLNYLP